MMNAARVPSPRPPVQIPLIDVVLVCTECDQTWSPDYWSAPGEAMSSGCPHCGGWTWMGQLAAPIGEAA